ISLHWSAHHFSEFQLRTCARNALTSHCCFSLLPFVQAAASESKLRMTETLKAFTTLVVLVCFAQRVSGWGKQISVNSSQCNLVNCCRMHLTGIGASSGPIDQWIPDDVGAG